MNLLQWCLVCLVSGLMGTSLAAEVRTIHVSPQGDDRQDGSQAQPLATLEAAQQQVRQLVAAGHAGPVEVVLAGGVWRLSEPLVFDHRDASRQTPVTYRAKEGERVVLSGGQELENWVRAGDFWLADVPAAELSQLDGRQLFLDGERAPRAHEPDGDWFRVVQAGPDRRTSFQYAPESLALPDETAGVELVFLHDWSITRVGLKEIDRTQRMLTFQHAIGGDHDFFAIDGFEPHARFRLENARAFADTPGEWFLDLAAGQLGIFAGSDQTQPPSAVIPRLATLLKLAGTAAQPVQGLTFAELEFGDTRCTLPAAGGAEVQAGFFQPRGEASTADGWLNRLAPAVEFSFAEECTLRNCRFRNLGGGGVYVHEQSHRNVIEQCEFRDLGGCAVMLGDPNPAKATDGEQLVCRDNRLVESRITQAGQILHGSVGVWIGIAAGTQVERNEVFNLPYTGVSVGWQWNPEPTGCQNNLIAGNHIHHVMQLLSDGGGIYTLGRQPGTKLRDNRIHHVPLNAGRAESNGIFMDEGSSLIEVTGNEIFETARAPIRFHKARELTVRGNRLSVAEGVQPFTYNATDPASITTEPNDVSVEASR